MKNISIGYRLGIGFSAVLALTILIVALAQQRLGELDRFREAQRSSSQRAA